jgi:hypothetical protein
MPSPRANRTKRNLMLSRWKLFSCYFGNRIIRISCPFVVMKLVRTTQTGTPYLSRYGSNFPILFLSLTCTMVVPSNTKAFISMLIGSAASFSKRSAFLTTGTDSPVRAHSLIRALPSRMSPSKGSLMGSFRKTISPGTTSKEDMLTTCPLRRTFTWI